MRGGESVKERQIFQELTEKINHCRTEEELETVSGLVEDYYLAGRITKREYKYLEEEQDDRLGLLIAAEMDPKWYGRFV